MTVKCLLLPKKRLMPLFVVCVLMAIALLYALFFNIHAASLVADIFVPLVLVMIILTAWLSRKQLNSLYLMMNNAYIRYQEDVVTGMVTYEQFCQNFLMENTPGSTDYHYWKAQREHTNTVNRDFIYLLLTKNREVVESAFAPVYPEHELPIDIFHSLHQEGKRLISIQSEENKEEENISTTEVVKATEDKPAPIQEQEPVQEDQTATVPDAPEDRSKQVCSFESELSDIDLSLLADCFNASHIITNSADADVSAEDLRDFFDCVSKPKNKALVLCKPKEFAYVMSQLSMSRLITQTWQAAIYNRQILVSQRKKKTPTGYERAYVSRETLSVAASQQNQSYPASAEVSDNYLREIRKNHK